MNTILIPLHSFCFGGSWQTPAAYKFDFRSIASHYLILPVNENQAHFILSVMGVSKNSCPAHTLTSSDAESNYTAGKLHLCNYLTEVVSDTPSTPFIMVQHCMINATKSHWTCTFLWIHFLKNLKFGRNNIKLHSYAHVIAPEWCSPFERAFFWALLHQCITCFSFYHVVDVPVRPVCVCVYYWWVSRTFTARMLLLP